MILKIENLHVYYGAIHAVKGISFEVARGEIVSLIGANGAGKTTTLRAISGLQPSTGTITLKDINLASIPPHARVRHGLAQSPEGRGVFSQMTVLENLEMGAYSRSNKKEIKVDLDRCLEIFPRLKERLWQQAGTMSGGEQQMLAISRALMCKPDVLLLDEPSLGLAPIIVSQIFEVIKELNEKNKMTILLVEQNARLALKISHRAYVLETGLIQFSGTGQDLLHDENVQRSYLGM